MENQTQNTAVMQPMLDTLAELEGVTETLSLDLARIDENFSKISNVIAESTEKLCSYLDENRHSLFCNKKEAGNTLLKIEIAGAALSFASSGLGTLVEAWERNRQLSELLNIKQQIAKQKLPVCDKMQPILDKQFSNSRKILLQVVNRLYDATDYTVETIDRNSLMLSLEVFRKSCLLSRTWEYYKAEFNAWLAGKQDSDIYDPNFYDVNKYILNEILFPLSLEDKRKQCNVSSEACNMTDLSIVDSTQVQGKQLLLFYDDQLLATLLSLLDDSKFQWSQNITQINKKVARLSLKNNAISLCRSCATNLERMEKRGDGTMLIIIIFVAIYGAISVGLYMLDWNVWVSWILDLLCLWFLYKKGKKKYNKAVAKYAQKIQDILFDANNSLLVLAGSKPRRKKINPDANGHPYIGAVIGGLVGFAVGPIGAIVGALIGAYLGRELFAEGD